MPMGTRFVIFLALAATPTVPAFADEFRNTPLGPFPSECVHQHPSGTTIAGTEGGIQATHPDGTIVKYPRNQTCVDFLNDWQKKHTRRATGVVQDDASGAPVFGSIDANFTASAQVTDYSVTYTVPVNPTVQTKQAFSYWIGLQDPNAGDQMSVLQPLIAYWGPDLRPAQPRWSGQVWNCCLHGQQHSGPHITGMTPGDTVNGSIKYSDADQSYTIKTEWNGGSAPENTSMTVKKSALPTGAIFNWVLVLLETRGVTSCDQLPAGPMPADDIVMQIQGKPITPNWAIYNPGNKCSSRIDATDTRVVFYTND